MEKNYMRSDAIVEFEFLEEECMQEHAHENPEILFVLEGELCVKTDQEEYSLFHGDFLLINANRVHSYRTGGKLFAVRFQLSMKRLKETLHRDSILFWCSSLFESSNACNEMRKLLQNILLCNVNKGAKDEFYESSLSFRLLSLLCGEFLLDSRDTSNEMTNKNDHMNLLMDYIRANYQKRISLQDAANALYLSPTYLSKYIRKSCGQGFIELIHSVRLSHAVESLMYTDDPIIKIAMDNGFASVAALNKAFRDTYDTTPSVYRKENKKVRDRGEDMKKTATCLRRFAEQDNRVALKKEEVLTLPADEYRAIMLENLMNAGRASDIMKVSTQDRILYCKRELGIRYIRFWNVFTEEMHMNHVSGTGKRNYGKLDEILDFLVKQKLIPYIELRPKAVRLLQTANKIVHEKEEGKDFSDPEEMTLLFRDFFTHLLRRYGHVEVSEWVFSYSVESDAKFENESFIPRLMDESLWNLYLKEFDIVADELKRRFPDARIGGPGFTVQHASAENLKKFLACWKSDHRLPDFISIISFPYRIVQENGGWHEQRRTDFNFISEDVKLVREAMKGVDFGACSLHLTECNLTLSDRNYINDSVIRAAFVANTVAKLYDKVELFGMWNALDAYSEYADSSAYLFGGSGILTKTGIAKPACFVLFFFNRLYREYVAEKDGFLITANNKNHYKLLVHNLTGMNAAYYLKEEDQLSAMGIEQMTDTAERKIVHVRIRDVADGCWQIRRYRLNRDMGSVLGEWLNFDMDIELRMEEVNYLAKVSPRMFIQKQDAKNGFLKFDIEMEPNEVQYLHITEFN